MATKKHSGPAPAASAKDITKTPAISPLHELLDMVGRVADLIDALPSKEAKSAACLWLRDLVLDPSDQKALGALRAVLTTGAEVAHG